MPLCKSATECFSSEGLRNIVVRRSNNAVEAFLLHPSYCEDSDFYVDNLVCSIDQLFCG